MKQTAVLLLPPNEQEEHKYDYRSPATDIVTEVSGARKHTHSIDLRNNATQKRNASPNQLQQRSQNPNYIKHNVLRICALSISLIIGYAINTIALLKSGSTVEIWTIIYATSSIWLFVSCGVMMFVTLYDFYNEKAGFNTNKSQRMLIGCFFIIGVCGHIASSLGSMASGRDTQIHWEHELLYSLLPVYIYIVCLIYFFQKTSPVLEMAKLATFSLILFITPFVRLLVTIIPLPSPSPYRLIAIYSSACIATSILLLFHIICFLNHYKTGLLLKLSILCALAYNIETCIREQVDFDKYDDKYRIYCYYTFLAALYIIYLIEVSIDPLPKVKQKPAEYYQSRKSFNKAIATQESSLRRLSEMSTTVQSVACAYNRGMTSKQHKISVAITVDSVIKIFADFKPCQANKDKYFSEIEIDATNEEEEKRLEDSITAIVPFYNEKANEILATLRSLYYNFRYIKEKTQKNTEYDNTHFNVLLVGDGWFKAHESSKKYLAQLYNCTTIDDSFKNINYKQNKHNTVILQTKNNQKLCINPFHNADDRLYLKVTTIIKIDNRKKANSHEWFLGKYGFAEWCKCDYMYFTDAYSTLNKKGLYKMTNHMKEVKNEDVVCCTGRARVYTIEQELQFQKYLRNDGHGQPPQEILYDKKWRSLDIFEGGNEEKKSADVDDEDEDNIYHNIQDIGSDHRLSINAHLRSCQMFEFEALYGTIGCYLLGGFLPVIPGPCGFYRAAYLLEDKVRAWYFKIINQRNDPNNMDLVLGNMKLAEDRILTITSIINCDTSVRHSLIPDCIFYFDPMPDLKSLMQQRRRWINGSIATIIFVLRKVSFSTWKVSCFRKFYVLLLWYMQLFMFIVLFVSPPILFILAFKYGLTSILDEILVDIDESGTKEGNIETVATLLTVFAWIIYLAFIYFAQTTGRKPAEGANKLTKFNYYFKSSVVKLMLAISYTFGLLTFAGLMMQFVEVIETAVVYPNDLFEQTFDVFVAMIGVIFFLQSFVLAPIFSKDIQTLVILLKTCVEYFMYAPFYVIFFFVNAVANVHDLSWGTRPDEPVENNSNPKHTTWKVLFFLLLTNITIALAIQLFTASAYANIIVFATLSLPSLFQLFFAFLWLTTTRFRDLMCLCIPRKIDARTEFTNEN